MLVYITIQQKVSEFSFATACFLTYLKNDLVFVKSEAILVHSVSKSSISEEKLFSSRSYRKLPSVKPF